eukprot:GEMP01138024.1.p2 GENE.GEMP01138024.1~~GEMP01138024.1.p2  ORF type:complete len:123 (+),score=24.60 GEMP01138024.1:88-456(+)
MNALSKNVTSLRFMQKGQMDHIREQKEQQHLDQIRCMKWVMPGMEEESASKENVALAVPSIRKVACGRRSFQNFNPVIESLAKDRMKSRSSKDVKRREEKEAEALLGMFSARKNKKRKNSVI